MIPAMAANAGGLYLSVKNDRQRNGSKKMNRFLKNSLTFYSALFILVSGAFIAPCRFGEVFPEADALSRNVF